MKVKLLFSRVLTLCGGKKGISQALTRMDEREQNESNQLLEKKRAVGTRGREENISEGKSNEHSGNLVTNQETDGLDQKANNASKDMKEDLPGEAKDIQGQETSVVVENKKENLQNCQQLSIDKKAKPIPKQNSKGRWTVPQPFSLSSEKRMSKTISSLEQHNPSLTRSLKFRSSSPAPLRTVQTSLRLERITELRQGTTKSGSIQCVLHTQTSLKVERSIQLRNGSSKSVSMGKEHSGKQVERFNQKKGNGQENQVERKKPQSNSNPKDMEIVKIGKSLPFKATPLPSFYQKRSVTPKSHSIEHAEQDREVNKIGKDSSFKAEVNKIGKDSSFKAAPLPSIYHRRSMSLRTDLPEKIEEKKVNIVQRNSTFKAAPLPSFYRKKSPPRKPELIKIPLTRSKSPNFGCAKKATSESGNIKVGSKGNPTSRQISDSAILKGPWKAPDQKPKVSRNNGPSCGDEVEKRVVSSIAKTELVSTN